jgi:hypothetical protein
VQAKQFGMPIVLWSNTDADTLTKDPKKMLRQIGTPRNGEILLCHDGPGKKATAAMLPMLLEKLSKKGYEFVTVPELLDSWDDHLASVERNMRVAKLEKQRRNLASLTARRKSSVSVPSSLVGVARVR